MILGALDGMMDDWPTLIRWSNWRINHEGGADTLSATELMLVDAVQRHQNEKWYSPEDTH